MQSNEEPSAPSPEEPQNRIRGVGETLRAARQAARVSLQQAGEELRIEPKFLAALEEERYEAIGIPVFAKGYLKLYCEYLGLDYKRLLPLYEEKAGKQAPPLRGRHSIERSDRPSSGIWVAVGVAVIVLILLVVWLLRDSLPRGTGVTVGTTAPSSVSTPALPAAATLGGAATQGAASSTDDLAARQGARSSAEVVTPPPAGVEVPQADVAAPAAEVTPPGPDITAPAGVATAASADAAAPASLRLDVDMKFVQDSWVEVKDSSDARLFYGLGKAGEQSHLAGTPPFAVVIGNADGVVLEVGGRPYAYPRRPRGKVASFTLSAPSE